MLQRPRLGSDPPTDLWVASSNGIAMSACCLVPHVQIMLGYARSLEGLLTTPAENMQYVDA
eukprot:9213981-Alexandrium_andersonii.AAC.1